MNDKSAAARCEASVYKTARSPEADQKNSVFVPTKFDAVTDEFVCWYNLSDAFLSENIRCKHSKKCALVSRSFLFEAPVCNVYLVIDNITITEVQPSNVGDFDL